MTAMTGNPATETAGDVRADTLPTTETVTQKKNKADKVGAGTLLLWQSRAVSVAINVVLTGYLLVYCTNALGMDAAIVGTIMFVSKIIDAVTDLVAGYIVDRTNTRWGRGRPYELCIIGLWLATWLMFTVPTEFSTLVKCLWIGVAYIFAQSIFTTLLNANGTVYMIRAFHNEKKYITLSSIGGLVSTVCVIIFNVMFPMWEAQILYSASGWSQLVLALAIPLGIIGLLRFFFIKEEVAIETSSDVVRVRDIITVLKQNRYIYPIAFAGMVNAILGSLGVANYYYIYIVGDVSIQGIMSLFSVVAMLSLIIYPTLLRRINTKQLIQLGLCLMLVAGALNWIAGANLPLLGVASIFSGLAMLPIAYMSGLMIIDCADYNEWKGIPRLEGTLSAINSFAGKLGGALGAFLLGVLLSVAAFDGTQETQPDSAIWMIRFLFAIVPAIFALLTIGVLQFYRLDAIKPQMQAELKELRATEMTADGASVEDIIEGKTT